MKSFGKYLGISIILLLSLFCIGVLYLFFVPNSSLFNISYLSAKDEFLVTPENQETINRLEVTSLHYPIKLISTSAENVSTKVFANSFGFVATETKLARVDSKIQNNTLYLNIIEPAGLVTKNNSYIEIYLPKKNLDVKLTNQNAITTLDDANLQINNFSYITEYGDLNLTSATISGTMNLNLKGATATLSASIAPTNINLDITTGRFDASNSTLNKIEIKSNNRGVIKINECAQIVQKEMTAGGKIEINKAGMVEINSTDTNIKIGETTDSVSVILTKSGNVEIGNVNNIKPGTGNFSTEIGSIKIGKSTKSLTLSSTHGDIVVNNAYHQISIGKLEYGEATINFAEDSEAYTAKNKSRFLDANMKNGKLTATRVEHINLRATENARINLSMSNVVGDNNKIEITGSGSANIIIDKNAAYLLTTSAPKGSVKVNLSQISEYGGYTDNSSKPTPVNCLANSENTLTVQSTTGSIYIVDTNLA